MSDAGIDDLIFTAVVLFLFLFVIVSAALEQKVKKNTIIIVDWDAVLEEIQQEKEPDPCDDDPRYW